MLSLYLRRSFRRRPMRHFALFWVLMCSFLLPLVVSVYRDSLDYGTSAFLKNFSQGQAIHISGDIQPEDTELLRDIDGMTAPQYDDGIIYLSPATEEAWALYSSSSSRNTISAEIRSRLAQAGHNVSDVHINFFAQEAVQGTQRDDILLSMMRKMLLLSLGLSLFAGLIIQSAYRNHIAAFSPELAELAALGATKGQIVRMFLLELTVLFPLAAGCAVGISYGVMRTLYKHFFEQTTNSSTLWQVFHMDAKSTALQISFYLLVCLGSLFFSLLRKPGWRLPKKGKRATSLNRLWVQQTKPPFVPCLLILIPLVTAFVVLFNQRLDNYAYHLESAQEVKIVATNTLGFTQNELDFIAAQSGVQQMEIQREENNYYSMNAANGDYLTIKVYPYRDIAPDAPDLEKNQFVANLPEQYKLGGTYEMYSLTQYTGKVYLELTQRLSPAVEMPIAASVYVSNALIEELSAKAAIIKVTIHTTLPYSAALQETLQSVLPEKYMIHNTGNDDLAFAAVDEGKLWLISWIFCVLALVSMQIVWVQLSAYVRECAPMLRTVHQLGASRRQVSQLIPVRLAAIAAATVPFFIAVVYTCMRYRILVGRMGGFLVSPPLVGIYALIAAVAALSFLLPVKCTLRQVLDKL